MPAKAVTVAPSVEPPDPLETAASRIRCRATREFRRCDDGVTPNQLLEAFLLLRHLRPGHIEIAIHCHGILVKQARSQLREYGFTDYWCDLIDKVHSFLVDTGWMHSDGRWLTRDKWDAEMWAQRERPAIVK